MFPASKTEDSVDWRPRASRKMLEARAAMLETIREFFAARGVLEVETPLLAATGVTDRNIESIRTASGGMQPPSFLQTSPEYAMKRLLAAGSGDIFQVCKAFRDGEAGQRHNPEFTLLEWYRVGWDHRRLMNEVDTLLKCVLGNALRDTEGDHVTYADALRMATGLEPGAPAGSLAAVLTDSGVPVPMNTDRDALLDLVFATCVQAKFPGGRLTFVFDYPADQAALARTNGDIAERFEVFLGDIELVNGFHELIDPFEQRERFERDNALRRAANQREVVLDDALLAALGHGLPACAGVAMGLDRVLMCATGHTNIADTLAFPATGQ